MSIIRCPECNKEISDKSDVCIHCGYQVGKMSLETPAIQTDLGVQKDKILSSNNTVMPKLKKTVNKKFLIGISITVILIIVVVVVIFLILNKDTSVNDYIDALKSGDVLTASTLYNEKIVSSENNKSELINQLSSNIDNIVSDFESGNKDYVTAKNEIYSFKDTRLVDEKVNSAIDTINLAYTSQLEVELDIIKNEYFDKKITYDDAKKRIDEIIDTDLLNGKCYEIENTIDKDNMSDRAYEDGIKYEKAKDYEKAMDKFNSVDSDNANYSDAQKRISDSRLLYETQIIDEVDKLVKNHQYSDALSKIRKAVDVIGETETLANKRSDVERNKEEYAQKIKEEEEQKQRNLIESAKNNQEMIVTSVSVEGPEFLNSNHVSVLVKNTTNKYTKSYKVCMLIFDKNGFPLVPEYNQKNVEYGVATKTIGPGETYGQDSYWNIFCPEKMYIKACVVSVEYQDGSSWTNDYFSYWMEQNKDKY